ncbi:MAG TPA: DUF6384 family protein [Trueperaceae bacterium]|nr:DUF6384 family protein [Trueperaceae bacterium]
MAETAPVPAGQTASDTAPVQLDDVMLAMDVVDTLRHREKLVAGELAAEGREEDMLARLRKVYEAQGIDVPDRILKEGVDALRENRFVYTPKGSKAGRRWAQLYIHRGRWFMGLVIAIVLVAAGLFAYDSAVRAPRRTLAADLQSTRAQITAVAETDVATQRASALYQQAQTALSRGEYDDARNSLETMADLHARLEREYTIHIVSNPDTGVWRVPDINTGARNYYLIVEAIDANGRRLGIPVENEETGVTQTVSSWGMRVDEETFYQVAADKTDDGIIQNDTFGNKEAGLLEPEYDFPTTGGAITTW